ncbi:hypothetical protein TNIN_465761 [Trichonephila inaurata madagascariensis]|uniref:Uncharacterized protein n=1 Tax=Trichonephila inaurata madagascariensis TaxID=2747483 RepID=A0A8X6IE47_9ARAC|nr:hypothetical protein TNIN_465761 [Trichonephila inaurata madagascariensis]
MESKKAKRTALCKSFTICANNIEKAIRDAKSSTNDFIALQELLQDTFRRLVEGQEILLGAILTKEDFVRRLKRISKKQKPTEIGTVYILTILEKVIQVSLSWLKNPSVSSAAESYSQKLLQLLKFLGLEVEGEQRVLQAKSGFKSDDVSRNKTEQSHRNEDVNTLPTSAALVSTVERKSVLITSKACFKCLKEKHSACFCENKNLHCSFCIEKWHHILLCPKKELNKVNIENAVSNTLSNQTQENSHVYLQTIALKISGGNRELVMQYLLDSGSEGT